MSRIKYFLFVFLVLILTSGVAQNNSEGEDALQKNKIEKVLLSAEILEKQGNYFQAIRTIDSVRDSAEKLNTKELLGEINFRKANLQYKLGNLEDAEITIINAINIQRDLNDDLKLAASYHAAGKIYIGLRKFDQDGAIGYLTSAKSLFENEGIENHLAEVILNQGIVYIQTYNFIKAKELLNESIKISKNKKLDKLYSAAIIKRGLIEYKENQYTIALASTIEGTEIAKSSEAKDVLNEGYQLLSDIYSEMGNYQLAHKNLKLSFALNEIILKEKRNYLIPEVKDQFNADVENALIDQKLEEEAQEQETSSFSQLTTFLSVALITILSLLTLSLYKNNNIRLKTNNMLYKKNEELLTEKERAEIAAKTKSNFLSTVTHELRTPLYAVTGLTNMLLEEDPKPDQMQHLKSLKFSGDYLLTFINDILQINKIEANKVELDPEIFNLKIKVENVIAALNNSAMDNNIFMHFEYDKRLPETYNGDQLKISQILINLIGNSIKFTKDGDIWVRVKKVKQNRKKILIKLEVEDNGIGITKEKQEHMFESFSQGSVQINRKYGGTGLGLSIVKGLIDILKGKIYMKSELGSGTTFSIEIPLEESKEIVAVKKIDYSQSLSKGELEGVRILVVEDNKINQMITKKILTKMSLACDLIDNGEEAVEMIKETNYNVVLMDIHMPGISGLEATKRIRAFDKDLTIFALTAVTLEDKMQEFDEAGFDDIISKPFKQEDFEKKLFMALSKNKSSASA